MLLLRVFVVILFTMNNAIQESLFSAYKSYILVYFDFLGPHPVDVFIQDFVFIGLVVICAP